MKIVHNTSKLLARISASDPSAFERLYQLHYPGLLVFAKRFTDFETARDMVSEVFLQIWQSRDTLHKIDNIKSYLTKSVQNACLNKLQAQKHDDKNLASFAALHEGTLDDYDLDEMRAEVYNKVYDEVSNLPRQMKMVLELSFLRGLKNKQIAEYLGVSEQTVKNQKTDALKKLRMALAKKPHLFILVLTLMDKS